MLTERRAQHANSRPGTGAPAAARKASPTPQSTATIRGQPAHAAASLVPGALVATGEPDAGLMAATAAEVVGESAPREGERSAAAVAGASRRGRGGEQTASTRHSLCSSGSAAARRWGQGGSRMLGASPRIPPDGSTAAWNRPLETLLCPSFPPSTHRHSHGHACQCACTQNRPAALRRRRAAASGDLHCVPDVGITGHR